MFLLNIVLDELKELFGDERILLQEPMSKHTSFKIGGPCDVLFVPQNVEEFTLVLKIIKKHNAPYYIMGNGSNLLVSDKGIRAVVIKTSGLKQWRIEGDSIEVGAGILLSSLSNIAYQHGLTGLEFASGIPGTFGGAIYMNAGAYGGEISQVLVHTLYATKEGQVYELPLSEHEFGYRKSIFHRNESVILEGKLQLKKGNKEEILAQMKDLTFRRTSKQPLEFPSAGSTFKRPDGFYAGKLVMDAGLSGTRIGGAMVSEKHCGFIINTGDATAKDVLDLVNHIKSEVKSKFGVELVPEIKMVGEEF
jgi:UDP-N-acetylmuramate dehydrogenase